MKLILGLERVAGDVFGDGLVDQLVLGAVLELADQVQAGLHVLMKAEGGGFFHEVNVGAVLVAQLVRGLCEVGSGSVARASSRPTGGGAADDTEVVPPGGGPEERTRTSWGGRGGYYRIEPQGARCMVGGL